MFMEEGEVMDKGVSTGLLEYLARMFFSTINHHYKYLHTNTQRRTASETSNLFEMNK